MDSLSLVLDPGHGGPLSYGAMWPPFAAHDGLAGAALQAAMAAHAAAAVAVEKSLNLSIARHVQRLLDGSGWPVRCTLTRNADDALELFARAAIGERESADLVIAIHCDSAANAAVSGLQAYVRAGDSVGLAVARDVMVAVPRALRRATCEPRVTHSRPDWTGAAHAVLARHVAPAVLIESGFVTNANDRAALTCDTGQALVASAVLSAVAAHVHRRVSG